MDRETRNVFALAVLIVAGVGLVIGFGIGWLVR